MSGRVPLIDGPRAGLPPLRAALLDELHRLKERRGEMIAAVDDDTGEVVGTIGLYPDKDEGGRFSHLAGIEVGPGPAADVEGFLLEEAGAWLRARRMTRLKFGTSPLLTRNAWLYVTRFGSRYRWREGARTPGRSAVALRLLRMRFRRPAGASPGPAGGPGAAAQRPGLEGRQAGPARRPGVLRAACPWCFRTWTVTPWPRRQRRDPGFIATLYAAFHALHQHGYGFAWFDRLAAPAGRYLVLRHEEGRDVLNRAGDGRLHKPGGKGLHSAAWTLRRRSS